MSARAQHSMQKYHIKRISCPTLRAEMPHTIHTTGAAEVFASLRLIAVCLQAPGTIPLRCIPNKKMLFTGVNEFCKKLKHNSLWELQVSLCTDCVFGMRLALSRFVLTKQEAAGTKRCC